MSTSPSAPEAARAGASPDVADRRPEGLTFEAIAMIAMIVASVAVVIAVFAVGLAVRAIDEHRSIPGPGAGQARTEVTLAEFSISPGPIEVNPDSTLAVTNSGTAVHDLTVEGEDLATPALDAGDAAELDIGAVAPGTYTVFCSIPGHRESGMETTLTVG